MLGLRQVSLIASVLVLCSAQVPSQSQSPGLTPEIDAQQPGEHSTLPSSAAIDTDVNHADFSYPDHSGAKTFIKRLKAQRYGITEMQYKTANVHWSEAIPPGLPPHVFGPCVNRFFTSDPNGVIQFDPGYAWTDNVSQYSTKDYYWKNIKWTILDPQSFKCRRYIFGDVTLNDNDEPPEFPDW